MKKSLLIISSIFISCSAFSQGTTGLVAHWKLNGNALDASGNGHNGTLHNITSTGGKAGTASTACYFTGSTVTPSYISFPYSSDFDVANYSICATVKIAGFYTGPCDANTLLRRGGDGSTGGYMLYHSNEFYRSCSCTGTVDTTMFNFACTAGSNPANCTGWQYSPAIQENQWYSLVATFDGSNFKIYVNGVLKTSNPSTSPVAIGTSTDSIVLGYNTWNAGAGYPYPFKGAMDDIRLYNRVLTTSEIDDYTNSTLDVPNTTNKEPEIAVYPNPANSTITMQLGEDNLSGSVQLLNALGQVIAEKQIDNALINFEIANLPTGMYMLKLTAGEQNAFRKFIKN